MFSHRFVSILMIFLNKHLLNSKELKFDAPLFVTWYQCVFSLFIYLLWFTASKILPQSVKISSLKIGFHTSLEVNSFSHCFICCWSFFREKVIKKFIFLFSKKKIIPLTTVFVAMITFNNLSLKYVPVSFYMIAKSLSTFFNVVNKHEKIFFCHFKLLKIFLICVVVIFQDIDVHLFQRKDFNQSSFLLCRYYYRIFSWRQTRKKHK